MQIYMNIKFRKVRETRAGDNKRVFDSQLSRSHNRTIICTVAGIFELSLSLTNFPLSCSTGILEEKKDGASEVGRSRKSE
jgi:hypothetical protein